MTALSVFFNEIKKAEDKCKRGVKRLPDESCFFAAPV